MEIIPIQIRDGVCVRIQGISHDLAETEANKIVDAIKAFRGKIDQQREGALLSGANK